MVSASAGDTAQQVLRARTHGVRVAACARPFHLAEVVANRLAVSLAEVEVERRVAGWLVAPLRFDRQLGRRAQRTHRKRKEDGPHNVELRAQGVGERNATAESNLPTVKRVSLSSEHN